MLCKRRVSLDSILYAPVYSCGHWKGKGHAPASFWRGGSISCYGVSSPAPCSSSLICHLRSFKLRDTKTEHNSIAHFYRNIEVWPYLEPVVVLAPSERPISSTAAKSLFLGGSGKLKLIASLHRSTWVAGQRCYVKIVVSNDTSKKVPTTKIGSAHD